MPRAPHPDDARESLRQWAQRRDEWDLERQALSIDLADTARLARSAGLSMTEIAELAQISRTSLYAATGARDRPVGEG